MTRRLAAAIGTGALVLAACGSGSSDSAEPADTAVVTDAPVESAPATAEPGGDAADPAESDEGSGVGQADEPSISEEPPAVDVPEILQFTSSLVGGGELDAATTAGTPTAFWFWAPT